MSSGRIPAVEGGIQPTIFDAKADILTATAADTPARLAVGANDTVLTADSSTATGLKWAAVSGGGMTLISRQTPSAASSLSFTSIAGTYRDLMLRYCGLYTSDSTATGFNIRFNNDSGLNYAIALVRVTTAADAVDTDNDSISLNMPLQRNTATTLQKRSMGLLTVNNYADTTYAKRFNFEWSNYRSDISTLNYHIINGVWNSTSAITSIDIYRSAGSGTFSTQSGGFVELWGIN